MNENATPSEKIGSGKIVEVAVFPADAGASDEPMPLASLRRRLVSLFYDLLLLTALLLVAGFAYVPFFGAAQSGLQKAAFQMYLLVVIAMYFVTFWSRGGQTLAMKTWRIRLVAQDGGIVTASTAMLRFVLAFGGLLCAGAGFWWALFDRDRQFFHDRMARTKIIRTN